MRSVHLNRMVKLEAPVRVQDGAGGHSDVWQVQGMLWASIRAGAGREAAGEFVTVSTVPYRIIVRASPYGSVSRPKPEQRFRDGARVFRILAVADMDETGRYLTCHAREEVLA